MFHALSIANEVLLSDSLRQEYDNKRNAKKREKERQAAFDSRRRKGKEDLERREEEASARMRNGGVSSTGAATSSSTTNAPSNGGGGRGMKRPAGWNGQKEAELQAKIARLQEQSRVLRERRDAKLRMTV